MIFGLLVSGHLRYARNHVEVSQRHDHGVRPRSNSSPISLAGQTAQRNLRLVFHIVSAAVTFIAH